MRSIPRTAIQIIIILTILGSMFLVHTNSRSSILIKEAVYVTGAALALLIASLGMLTDGTFAGERFSRSLIFSFLLLIAWIVFRHFTGIQSVNGPGYIFSTIALAGLVSVIAGTFIQKTRDIVLWALVISTVLLSVYAILQFLGMIIFPWDAGLTQMSRSSSTMGNANLLGSFSIAMLPVGSGFLLSRLKLSRFRLPAAACFALLCTGAILVSKTRGSLIGLFAIAAFLPFVSFIRKNKRTFLVLLIVIAILIAGSFLLLGNRMEELAQTGSGTLQVRKLIWSGTLSMILENPVIGYGPGSFQILFPQFRNPQYFILGVSHNTLHAHCEYFEILVDTGIIGLLLWAAVALSIFRIVYKNRKSLFPSATGEGVAERWLVAGIIAGLVALLSEASVSVALRWPPSALLLALFTGLLLASIPSKFAVPGRLRRYFTAAVFLLLALLLGIGVIPDYLRRIKAGRELFVGKDIYLASIQGRIEGAVNASSEWRISEDDAAAQRALYYYNSAVEMSDSSITWCKRCVETNPDELGGWYALGSCYITAARLYQQISPPMTEILRNNGMPAEEWDRAQELTWLGLAAFDSLTARAPDYAEIHNNLALVWINLGNPDSALSSLRNAWDLHAHNRKSYLKRVMILTAISHSMDGLYLKWQRLLKEINKRIGEDVSDEDRNLMFRMLMFDFGTTLLRYEEKADSLGCEFINLISYNYPEFADEINEYTETVIQRSREGMDLLDRFEEGDTTGVLSCLDGIQPHELDKLPLQRALMGLILTARGDMEGMSILNELLGFLSGVDISDVTIWPIDVSDMMSDLNEALLERGVDDYGERQLYISNEMNMLNFDRRIFEIMIFIESSDSLQQSVYVDKEKFELIWERIGGPLYCFMRIGDVQAEIPAFGKTSLLGDSYSGILELESSDSLNAEIVKLEIEWLYVLFCSSYNAIPHYSIMQSDQIVFLLADARNRLAGIVGENEAQYQLGSMFNDISDLVESQVSGEYLTNVEALRSDLILGRISLPDLP